MVPKNSNKSFIYQMTVVVGACLFLIGYVCFLMISNYLSQVELQKNLRNQLLKDSEKQALSLSYFFAERRNDLLNLSLSREVRTFFENKDLGMSLEYGLKLSLFPIRERMANLHTNALFQGSPIYNRLLLTDPQGRLLVDYPTGGNREPEDSILPLLSPAYTEGAVLCSGDGRSIIFSVAYTFKNRHVGQVLGWINPSIITRGLLNENHSDPLSTYLIYEKEGTLRPVGNTVLPYSGLLKELQSALPGQVVTSEHPSARRPPEKKVLLKLPVKGTPFLMVRVLDAATVFGELSPHQLLVRLGIMTLGVLSGAFLVLYLAMRILVVRTRLRESRIREQQVQEKKRELEMEMVQRSRVEEALRESEGKLRTILDSIFTGILIIDPETHTIVDINPMALQLLGESRENIIGSPCHRVICPAEEGKCPVTDLGQEIDNSERQLLRSDGRTLPIIKKVVPITLEGRKHLLESFFDISDLRRSEEEKNKIQAQLIQGQKMESIGILAGGVAHDFNNILTSIHGYAELAALAVSRRHPLYENLEAIQKAALRAADLTRQLLLFSRKQPMDSRPLDLNELIQDLLKMLDRLIGEDITIETDLAAELPGVMGDSGNIEQVMMNLVVNARDALPHGGLILIKTETALIGPEYTALYSYAYPGRFVVFSVTDRGLGMDKATQNHIFDPFFTTKGPGQGTGLGLSVVYGIVKQHKGWINVYSEPGHGSVFRIYLPVTDGVQTRRLPTEKESLFDLKGRGEGVLLVEDDRGIRELLQQLLSDNGYQAVAAANAEEAVLLFEASRERFDLLLSDVVLPGESGIQLAETLLTQKGGLKVLLSSGYPDHKSQWSLIQEKGYHFLPKPFELKALLKTLRAILRNG
jgi:PAS domain S-box-containing protein